jgi:type IV pilus assembly protein PilB
MRDVQFIRKGIAQQDYNRLLEQYVPDRPAFRQMKEQELETMVNLTEFSAEVGSSAPQPEKIAARLQELEKLLALLGYEFELLKQELQMPDRPFRSTPPSVPPQPVYEELKDARNWETLVRELAPDRATSIGEGYEELTDPGDWEKLREELEPDKETIVSDLDGADELSEWTGKPRATDGISDPWS